MNYLIWFIMGFSILQLLVAFVNLLFRQGFQKNQNFPDKLVSVLIPARNEESTISNLINDLQNQEYQNIEIIVFNDLSTDRTADIVTEYSKSDSRIKLINSDGLPEGWLGKNFACHTLSNYAKGSYFLFLDADVRIGKGIISNTLTKSEQFKLGLLSIFPKQQMLSWGEKIAVPNMNFILLSLLPLILVRKLNFSSLAAANGQFMLFNAEIYIKYWPHELMKANKVEDIEIARYFKKKQIKIACLVGDESITCRMYNGFTDAVNGFSKNVVNFFGNSFIVAVSFWMITTLGFLVLLADLKLLLAYLFVILITRVTISMVSKQKVLENLLLIVPQQLALGMFIYRAFNNKFKKQYIWKGRNIS